MRRALPGLVLLALVLAASACGDDDGGSSADTTASSATTEDLDGRSFVSTGSTGYELVADTTVTLAFADGQMSVQSGCNTQNGGYEVNDGQLALTSELASTMMGCEQALMDQDQWVAQFLGDDPEVILEGDRLTLARDGESLELTAES